MDTLLYIDVYIQNVDDVLSFMYSVHTLSKSVLQSRAQDCVRCQAGIEGSPGQKMSPFAEIAVDEGVMAAVAGVRQGQLLGCREAPRSR